MCDFEHTGRATDKVNPGMITENMIFKDEDRPFVSNSMEGGQ